MFRFESLPIGYFIFLAVAAAAAPVSLHRAIRGFGAATVAASAVVLASTMMPESVRIWLPHAYLVAGYWLPALLTPAPTPTRFEAWLRRHDRDWRKQLNQVPDIVCSLLELSYLACFFVVPCAFVVVWKLGTIQEIERFWMAVLLAAFACYVTLPWLASRPPRFFAQPPPRLAIASFNVKLLRAVSHGFNTFPSGHVAVAIAAALSLLPVSRAAGVICAVVAAGIAAGAVSGRYHYGPDVAAGAVVGIMATFVAA